MAITLSSAFVTVLEGTSSTAGLVEQIGGGSLVLYSGTPPTGANEALAGDTVLATFAISAAGSQTVEVSTPWQVQLSLAATTVTATGTGTASFWRILNSGATCLIQGTAGTSGADWNLSSTAITSGDNVSITGSPTIGWPVV
jgi:hypothetical protein